MERKYAESTIVRKLNKFARQIMEEHPEMNCGGCCVFAALVSAHLAKIIPVKIHVEGSAYLRSLNNIDHIRPKVVENNWCFHNVDFNHVLISYEINGTTYYYDSRGSKKRYVPLCGARRLHEKTLHPGSLTINEASFLASEDWRWNKMFNRSHIPKLINQVDEFFEKEFKIR